MRRGRVKSRVVERFWVWREWGDLIEAQQDVQYVGESLINIEQ
jgi:hypothetical protein